MTKPLKTILFAFLAFVGGFSAHAQKITVSYATRDTQVLKMDIYPPAIKSDRHPCIIFVFGGGFFTGKRDAPSYIKYFQSLADSGFAVASIDYRLGLKNLKKPPSLFNRKPLIHAIEIAVEDLYAATAYLIQHAEEFHIDTSMIIASGSSAGAITVLTADYQKRNQNNDSTLPKDFQYAGIISFAGAIYSHHGRPDYAIAPAPMLLFHGNKDDVVPYKKISLFGTGIFGPSVIVRKFKEHHFPYEFFTMDGIGHDVAVYPMRDFIPEIHTFIRQYIFYKRPLYENILIKDDNRKNSNVNFSTVFKKRK